MRCGWLSRADLLALGRSADEASNGILDLAAKQKLVKNKCRLNPNHDFSGTPTDQANWQFAAAPQLSEALQLYDSDEESVGLPNKAAEGIHFKRVRHSKKALPQLVADLARAAVVRAHKVGEKAQQAGANREALKAGLPKPFPPKGDFQQGGASGSEGPSGVGSTAGAAEPQPKKKRTALTLSGDPSNFGHFLGVALDAPQCEDLSKACVAQNEQMRQSWVESVVKGSDQSSGAHLMSHLQQIRSFPAMQKTALSSKILAKHTARHGMTKAAKHTLHKLSI